MAPAHREESDDKLRRNAREKQQGTSTGHPGRAGMGFPGLLHSKASSRQRLQRDGSWMLRFPGWKSWKGQILMEKVYYRSSFQLCGVEWFEDGC